MYECIWLERRELGFASKNGKWERLHTVFFLCVLVAKALGFLLMVGASLHMVGVGIPPIFALDVDVVDGLTEFDDEIWRHMRI